MNNVDNNCRLMAIGARTVDENCGLMSIGMQAPDFTVVTTMGTITMSDFRGKWVVFFSHPGAFSPVCATELLSFAHINQEFEDRNAQIIALSVDGNHSHLAWLNQIHEEEGVIIPFPIIADVSGNIARQYGMISPVSKGPEAARNVLIIDPDQIVRAILIYPLNIGRNIPEVLRILIAIQTAEEHNVATPANWFPNQPVMVPVPQTHEELIQRKREAGSMGLSCRDWWWCNKQLPPDND